jgi:hypothetical protein
MGFLGRVRSDVEVVVFGHCGGDELEQQQAPLKVPVRCQVGGPCACSSVVAARIDSGCLLLHKTSNKHFTQHAMK